MSHCTAYAWFALNTHGGQFHFTLISFHTFLGMRTHFSWYQISQIPHWIIRPWDTCLQVQWIVIVSCFAAAVTHDFFLHNGNIVIDLFCRHCIRWFRKILCVYCTCAGLNPQHKEVAKATANNPQSLLPRCICTIGKLRVISFSFVNIKAAICFWSSLECWGYLKISLDLQM